MVLCCFVHCRYQSSILGASNHEIAAFSNCSGGMGQVGHDEVI